MGKYLFGADFGTTGVKAVLLDPESLQMYFSDVYDYPTFHKHHGWADQDPNNWWEAFKLASNDVINASGIAKEDIAAVGLSGMGGACVCIDKDGNSLRDTMFWMDARTEKQSEWLRANFKDELLKYNSNSSVTFTVPQLLWVIENEPEIYEKTEKMLTLTGFVNFKLTGEFSANPCENSLWCILDLNTCKWNEEFADKLGIDINKLPPMSECADIIGKVTADAAALTGLPEGIPVIAGGHDLPSSVLGMGISTPGEVFYSMGTGSNLAVLTGEPILDLDTFTERHVMPNVWIYDAVMTNTGGTLKWFVNEFGQLEKEQAEREGRNVFEIFSEYAEKAPAGSHGLVFAPYLNGEISPIFDGNARGVFFGLSYLTNKDCMTRAIMEGVCMSVLHNMKVFEKIGININEFKVQGGPAKSRVWMQIMADVTNKRIITLELADASPLGNAILAGSAIGLVDDPVQLAGRLVNLADVFEPNPDTRGVYDTLFEIYKNIYEKNKDDFAKIADM